MVQQTKDSAFTEYGLAHAESGLSNSDKHLSASVAAKKSEFQDLRNESPIAVPEPVGSPFLMEDSKISGEVVKISGIKRPKPDCLQGSPKINAASGHIVYVRRKPEIDLAKSNIRDTQSDAVDRPPSKKSVENETPQQLTEMNESVISVPDVAPLHRASSPSLSSTRRSVSPSLGISGHISSPENIEHVHHNCANPSSEDQIMVNVALWEEQFHRLQSFLKVLDQSDQYEYVQMLRSLSSVELSRHAVELENRSIKLSLEEAKEMQRVRFIDVLGKYGKNVRSPSTQQEQLHK
ncbi:hypothetical protein ACS0TY_011663 [Phlomoides rotata]